MIPCSLSGRTVANRDVEVARCIPDGSRRCPYPAFARRGDAVDEQRSLTIGPRSDDAPDVIRTVTIQTSIGDVDHAVGKREGAALLVRLWVHAIGIDQAAHFHL